MKQYIQAHVIIVLNNIPLQYILLKPDISGRTFKWALDLSEYQINFSSRKTIQGQALADFIVECTFSDSSNNDSSHLMPDMVAT